MDSYLPRQISQSGCEINSNCGKKYIRAENILRKNRTSLSSPEHLNKDIKIENLALTSLTPTSTCECLVPHNCITIFCAIGTFI